MSRQNTNLIRGLSNDERTKHKTKKGKHHQEKRTDYNHLKTHQYTDSKNVDLLLNVATSMSQFVQRNSTYRFKSNDLKVMELIIAELTFIKRIQEYEKEQNKGKVKEMKSHIQRIREKRSQIMYQSERINMLIRSGSPKNRKPLIACEMSPQMLNQHNYGLIQRKIEEENNRQRTTFESIKRKEQCFKRLFEYVDKIFDKLNLQKLGFSFKTNMARIQSAIQAITNRQIQLKTRLKENAEFFEQIEKLKKQNEKLKQQQKSLNNQINTIKSMLKEANIKYSQLQQDFSLIVKEKLDAETAFSKIHHQLQKLKDKNLVFMQNLRITCSQILKQQVEQLKNNQILLKRQILEQYRSLKCQSVTTINNIIYRYTNELKHISQKQHKLKRQVVFLQNENNKNVIQLSKEIADRQQQLIQRDHGRRNRLILVKGLSQYHYIETKARTNTINIWKAEQFYYVPNKIHRQMPNYLLQISPKMYQIYVKPRQTRLAVSLNQLQVNICSKKECLNISTQSQQQCFLISTNNLSVQTDSIQIKNRPVQTQIQMQNSSTQTIILNSLILNQAYQMASITPSQSTKAISTSSNNFSLSLAYNQAIKTFRQYKQQTTNTITLQSKQQSTNTDFLEQTYQENKSTNIKQTKESGVNTQYEYQQYQDDDVEYIHQHIQQLSNKKMGKGEDTIFSLLLQAQQCLIVPEISVLRQEISIYRNEIEHLKQKCSSLQKQRQAEQQNVFQFCY